MSSLTVTIPAANVANIIASITTINTLIANGNANLLSTAQNTAMQNVNTLMAAHPSGFLAYTLVDSVANDFFTFGQAVNNLANTGPTLTYAQNIAAAGTINPITSNGFPTGANTCVYNDTYGIAESPGNSYFVVSNSADFSTWSPLAQVTAEANADRILAVDILNGQIVAFCTETIQFYTDQALVPQVYAPIQGATQDYGLAAIYSRAPFMGSIAFLGQNFEGTVQVFILNNYTPTPISTPDINNLINSFEYVNDAVALSYTIDGHSFYELTFPIAGYSFLYDGLTGIWSTVQSGVQETGRHITQLCATFNYNNFASDYLSGNIYLIDPNNYTEAGAPIKRMVTSRHIYEEGNEFQISEVFVDCDTGEGLQPGSVGSDPKMALQVSKNNGRTFGSPRVVSMGKVGQYKGPRVLWRRLGSSRDFVLRFTCTDPVPFILTSASAVIIGGVETSQ